jgi:hypothetical protein
MEVYLFDFVEQCLRLVKQALGKHVLCTAFGLKTTIATEKRRIGLKYMAEIRDALSFDRDDFPSYSTIYKSSDRLEM